MADEVILEGKEYVSSKRAADLSGYAQDYIGQLARAGLIDAKRVGGLWYISADSLEAYKNTSEKYVPELPREQIRSANPDSLVSFDGRDYISSVRASKLTGYNQDYIGQLARSGKILSRQVGNRWYIDRESLLDHKKEKDGLLAAVQVESVGLAKPEQTPVSAHAPIDDETFFTYLSDKGELLPSLATGNPVSEAPMPEGHILNLHASNKIPIQKISNRVSAPVSQKILPAGQKWPQGVSAKEIKKGSLAKNALAGVLTVVIVLSLAFASFKDKSIYASATPSFGTAKQDALTLSAAAEEAFAQVGNTLAQWITPQLQYQRQD